MFRPFGRSGLGLIQLPEKKNLRKKKKKKSHTAPTVEGSLPRRWVCFFDLLEDLPPLLFLWNS